MSREKPAFEPWRNNLRRRNLFLGALTAAAANAVIPVVDLGLQANVILCADSILHDQAVQRHDLAD